MPCLWFLSYQAMEPAQVSCLAYEVIYEGSFSFSNVLWIERTFEIRDWRLPSLWKGFLSFVKNVLYPRHSNRRRRVFNNWKIFSKIPPQIEAKLQRKRHHTMCLEWYSTCSAHWYQRNSGSCGASRQAVGWAVGTPRAQNGRKVVDWNTRHRVLCTIHYALCKAGHTTGTEWSLRIKV